MRLPEHRSVGRFNRVIADKGHACKTISTRAYQAVSLLNITHYWFLSATPMPNRPLDICGYLTILYNAKFDKPAKDGSKNVKAGTDSDDPINKYSMWAKKAA